MPWTLDPSVLELQDNFWYTLGFETGLARLVAAKAALFAHLFPDTIPAYYPNNHLNRVIERDYFRI
jgi:hypothetical protein